MTDREAMQQALDALTRIWEDGLENFPVWAHEAAIDNLLSRLAQPEQEPVIGKWSLREVYFDEDGEPISHRSPPQRKPLTDEQVNLFINGRGDEGDDDYVEPTGDGFGLTDTDLVRLVRRVEAAHGITGEQP